MIGKSAEQVIQRAIQFALDRSHELLTVEHIFLSMLEDERVIEILQSCGADTGTLKESLEYHLEREVPRLSPEEAKRATRGPLATPAVERLIQRAIIQVQSSGKSGGEVQPEDLLVSLFQADGSFSMALLEGMEIERLDVVEFLSHGLGQEDESVLQAGLESQMGSTTRSQSTQSSEEKDPLKQYAVDLNARAKAGKIDPLVGRKLEIERMIQTLCRRRKNNPLLVGEAGVGKTALAEGLAWLVVNGEVPDLLQNAHLYQLDLGTLIAGTKYRGDFEARIKKVLQALEKRRNSGELPIVVIDEIHMMVGAGQVGGGVMDAANLLKPALARGDLRCIGSTTYNEYRGTIEKDPALARRFQKIDVPEPSSEEAIQILQGLKTEFEKHHQCSFTDDALKLAVELSVKHLTDRHLPDKAIDVLDEAGARARLRKKAVVDASDIEAMIARMARIPEKTVNRSQKDRLRNLERDLKRVIYGQDHAIESLVSAIRMARSGLRTGEKPVGSFLFCGPTGVGKTELSKQLALALGIQFQRFDMSEYGEKHTVSRLIGAPPGYVGFDQAGLLTDALMKNPHSVVLLDEVEKAHPDIWNILLQVMDHGTLTDNNGKKADFRNAVIIMTSNVGSREMERQPLGIGAVTADGVSGQAKKEVERTFTPEFRNRLDSVVFFNPLNEATMAQVVDKQVTELETLLLAKGVDLRLTREARDWLGKKGFDRRLGARPLSRIIQDEIKRALADEILFGKLEGGGSVSISVDTKTDRLVFEIHSRDREKATHEALVGEES
ncbi:ATP-dependent Clp protease ATP-binding subunit ClpA [bacterium]|nr:ATP-dependent Clp protease ATP-binding subunit ClpA [bacterium]